jgi:hypothetical protein
MAKKVLVPVMPTERFYDACVAAADLVSEEGGMITFLFTQVRPPAAVFESFESQTTADLEVQIEVDGLPEAETIESWEEGMERALADAKDLLYERGLGDDQIEVVFADGQATAAENIANEAAAGGYDVVVLARGYFIQLPDQPGQDGHDVAKAVQALAEDGVQLLVT